jgi:ABC-2 type transport system permease protein
MKTTVIVAVIAVLLVVRLALFRTRRRRRSTQVAPKAEDAAPNGAALASRVSATRWSFAEDSLGDVGLVAGREIRERLRGRIFRVGTIIMLLAVSAAIVIPTLHKNSSNGASLQKVGVVGTLSPVTRDLILSAAQSNSDKIKFVPEASVALAKSQLKSGASYLSIIDSSEVLLYRPATASSSPADPGLVDTVAEYLGVVIAYHDARLTPSQAKTVTNSHAVPIHTLVAGSKGTTTTPSIIGIVLLFLMLTQYCTWIMIGVMQEKSSRVVEVLLATVRPIQLLGGKVLGIGLVALGQALLLVGVALGLGAAVGSNVLHGSAPLGLLAELAWLVLGYAFYCWVYAAAGSMAERQDQVQTLALPLSIPILFGYIYSITVASSGSPNAFFDVLAYFPPTAPFCMSVLVGLGRATWWEFLISAAISIVATAGMAILASRIYRRAVLRTGARVSLRDLFNRNTA